MRIKDTPSCFASHLGLWLMEPVQLNQAVAAIKANLYQPTKKALIDAETMPEAPKLQVEEGVAIIPISGPLMKGRSKYGGTSTVDARRMIREAVNSDAVNSILLVIDSPGGHVAGTDELANDVRTAKISKPVFAHIEDLGASAAYWIASQATRITANRTAEVGSIGTVAIVEDTSGMMEKNGIKVHVVSTGAHKGAFADGAPVTDQHLADLRSRLEDVNKIFLSAVKEGRSMTSKQLDAVSDGRVFIAEKALELGLIDGVATLEAAYNYAYKKATPDKKKRRMEQADVLIRLAKFDTALKKGV